MLLILSNMWYIFNSIRSKPLWQVHRIASEYFTVSQLLNWVLNGAVVPLEKSEKSLSSFCSQNIRDDGNGNVKCECLFLERYSVERCSFHVVRIFACFCISEPPRHRHGTIEQHRRLWYRATSILRQLTTTLQSLSKWDW